MREIRFRSSFNKPALSSIKFKLLNQSIGLYFLSLNINWSSFNNNNSACLNSIKLTFPVKQFFFRSVGGVLLKKVFLEISQNSQENTCKARHEACNFIKKETLAQVFSCEFCKISKNTFGRLLLNIFSKIIDISFP